MNKQPPCTCGPSSAVATLQGTRREFFSQSGLSIGAIGLANLLGRDAAAAEPAHAAAGAHFPARAKAVIYLFMAGGPSQLELFDNKRQLRRMSGQRPPESFMKGTPLRLSQGQRDAAGAAAGVPAVRRVGRRDQRSAAPSPGDRRRDLSAEGNDHRRVQPRAGQAVPAVRLSAAGAALDGLLGHLRNRQRGGQPAGLCRPCSRARADLEPDRRCGPAASCRPATRASPSAAREIRFWISAARRCSTGRSSGDLPTPSRN